MARPAKYKLDGLEIGNSLLIEWLFHPKKSGPQNYMAIRQAVYREEQKGKKFRKEGKSFGMLVTRIK